MNFSATVTSVTREAIVPKVYDTLLKGNVGLLRLLGNARPWRSGFRYDVPIRYTRANTGGLVGIGGTLDTSRADTRTKMQFNPKRRHKPVVIDDVEKQLNKGDEQVLELLATEMETLASELLDEAGNDFYTGTGSGENFDSILNASDDSTSFSTYGSLARATYTTIKGYLATSIGVLATSDMATAYNAVKVGQDKPSVILADVTSWTAYEGLLQPTVRAGYEANGFPQVTRTGVIASQRALGGDIGFDSIYYRGTPLVEDEKCTSGYQFYLNEKYFYFAGVDLDDYEKINLTGDKVDGPQNIPVPRGFNWSGLLRGTQQPAEVGHLYIIGNYIAYDPRRAGNLQGITG